MTALAAEPEMSIVAFVLADTRFEGKNWPNLEIADDQSATSPSVSDLDQLGAAGRAGGR